MKIHNRLLSKLSSSSLSSSSSSSNNTLNNFKVIISCALWFITYMIMGIFGGSVAYLHFERSDKDVPDPLPDFGYDIIPYYCPRVPYLQHGNVQSIVLFILYTIILSGAILRWKPKQQQQCHNPKNSGTVNTYGGDGRLILQQLCHLNCLIFLTRTSTVGLTGLPQPNPRCVGAQHSPTTFENAIIFVMGRPGLLPHACGDLIYSGHVGCTLICMTVLHRHGFLRNKLAKLSAWSLAVVGIYFTISCRSHYSVDVMLAFYFGYFLPEWYFNRSDGLVRGKVSRWIRRLEVQPEDLMPRNYEDANANANECGANHNGIVSNMRSPPTISATYNENVGGALLLCNSVSESFMNTTDSLSNFSSTTNSLA